MNSEALLRQLTALASTLPNFRAVAEDYSTPIDTQRWIGRLHALLEAAGRTTDVIDLRVQSSSLMQSNGRSGGSQITQILYRALADAELHAPAASQGAFIAAGNEFQAFTNLAKILGESSKDVLIVDPYMDETALVDFGVLVREGVSLRLLTDEATVKPTLAPAFSRWTSQYGSTRPVAGRLAAPRTLHDRLLILDSSNVWILTQSLKDFAKRAHGSIARTDEQSASLKIAAYQAIWDASSPLLI